MTMLEAFVKERNEALFSLDRKKIEAYMIKIRRNGDIPDTRCCFLGIRVQGHLRHQGCAGSHCKQGKGMAARTRHES